MKSSTIIGGKSDNHERHEADAYYTPKECTLALIKFLESRGILNNGNKIWECAAGEDDIAEVFLWQGYEVVSTDIKWGKEFNFMVAEKQSDIVVSNPPYNFAAEFIRRAIELQLSMFCFLLKSQYFHAATRLPLFESYAPSYVLPLTWRPVFVPNRGKQPTMEFSWFVWIEGNHDTRYIPLKKPQLQFQEPLF